MGYNRRIFMRNLYVVLLVLFLTSCGSYNLSKSVWTNISPVEKDGVHGTMVTSMYFVSDSLVDTYKSVWVDTIVVVEPYLYSKGIYLTKKLSNKASEITISSETIDGKTDLYKGEYNKGESMILLTTDSLPKLYGRIPNVKLP